MVDQQRRGGIGGIGDGIRTGIGILSAVREAVEETFRESVDRGDMSPEGAKSAMRDVAQRLQTTLEETRERFDFVGRKEYDDLLGEVAALRARVEALESGGEAAPPQAIPDSVLTE